MRCCRPGGHATDVQCIAHDAITVIQPLDQRCAAPTYRLSCNPSRHTAGNSVDLVRPTWPTPFSRSPGFPVDDACAHRRPRHWMSRQRDGPLSATERFPSPQQAQTWNSLPAEMTSSNSLQTFKTKLKSRLFFGVSSVSIAGGSLYSRLFPCHIRCLQRLDWFGFP